MELEAEPVVLVDAPPLGPGVEDAAADEDAADPLATNLAPQTAVLVEMPPAADFR